MLKSITLICLSCIYSIVFSQNLPLELYWAGKTDKAYQLAEDITSKKSAYSKQELSNAYDFLAEVNLEQGHFENNLSYLNYQFNTIENSIIDSALFYARLANYYNCYIMTDSAEYFCKRAYTTFSRVKNKSNDSLKTSRYFSFFGNAARNNSYRNIAYLDSALLYSNKPFLKALHSRRYATFLTDFLPRKNINKWNNQEQQNYHNTCLLYLTRAEQIANQIYPDKKSDLHSKLYSIWGLAEKYANNASKSNELYKKSQLSLVKDHIVLNDYAYASILNWDAWNKLEQYYTTKQIKLLYDSEHILTNAIASWERFYAKESKSTIKGFDDQYSVNPYHKLIAIYFELYTITKNKYYLAQCYGLGELIKNRDSKFNLKDYFNNSRNYIQLHKIETLSKQKNCAVVNYLYTRNPHHLIAIVTLPDTTFMISCAKGGAAIMNYFAFNEYKKQLLNNELQEFKNNYYSIYKNYFKNISGEIDKRKLKNIVIIPDGGMADLNFDLLQSDSLPTNSISKSSLINNYNFTYSTCGDILSSNYRKEKTYHAIEFIIPDYTNSNYAKLTFGNQLKNMIEDLYKVNKIQDHIKSHFFQPNQLIHFIGHAEADNLSNEQFLILNNNESINSSDVLNYNLSENSYILNGCNSNLGRTQLFNKTSSFSFNLINQKALSVISATWQLDDKNNAEFMKTFYKKLSQGLNSSDALHQAKIDCIEKNINPSVWAAYKYFGNDFVTEKNNLNITFWGILIVLSLLIILLIIYKIKIRSK